VTSPVLSSETDSTVFVIDDDQEVRTGLQQLLSAIGLPVQTFASAQSFLDVIDASRPGCVVTDIRMPGMTGIELQKELRQRNVRLPVIVITAHGDVSFAVEAFHGGAIDFLQKPYRPQHMISRIREALARDQARRLLERELQKTRTQLASLTQRESEVMERLVDGKTTKEISRDLGIGLSTVDYHRGNVLMKLEVDNTVNLAVAVQKFRESESQLDGQ
jgi:two-component system response regulator FixJ